MRAWVLGVAWLAAGACARQLPLDGAPCPCADGYTCDEARGVCVPAPPDAGAERDTGAPPFSQACPADTRALPPSRLRLLRPAQYAAAVERLTGHRPLPETLEYLSAPTRAFEDLTPPPPSQKGVEALAEEAQRAAQAFLLSERPKAAGCPVDQDPHEVPASCSRFLGALAERAYRRPLPDPERNGFLAMVAAETTEQGLASGVQAAVEFLLQSPAFLFRSELGARRDDDPTVAVLNAHELASEIAFLVSDEGPDDPLLADAASGKLLEPGVARDHIKRLQAAEPGRRTMRDFFWQLLELGRLDTVQREPLGYPEFGPALKASMRAETVAFLDRLVFDERASLHRVFTANVSFPDARLGALYDLPSTGLGATPTRVANDARPGLLAQATFLAAHPNEPGALPFRRGRVIAEALLCAPVALTFHDTRDAGRAPTARERLDDLRADASRATCLPCHETPGALTLGFEQFDELGRLRTHENGVPIDTTVPWHATGTSPDTLAVVAQILNTDEGRRCFVERFVAYGLELARDEMDPAAHACVVANAFERFRKRNDEVKALPEELTELPGFWRRQWGSP